MVGAMSFVSLLGLGVALFATTNIDDVFVLLGFFSDPKFKTRQIVVGQYAGIASLFAVSGIASLVSLVLAPAYVGLLGFAPMAIGLWKVRKLWGQKPTNDERLSQHESAGERGNIVAVAAVTIANGGDNLSIYTPLFATRSGIDLAALGVVFAAMTGVWLLVAHWLTSHRTLGALIRRYGHRAVPVVLIVLGFYIIRQAGTLSLLSRLQ